MTTASRARKFRQRQRRGLAVWSVEVAEIELSHALVEAGLVHPDASTDEYKAAAARVLSDFVSRYSATRYGAWLAGRGKGGA